MMNKAGSKLSRREFRLFVATCIVLCVAGGFLVVSSAFARLSDMDASIDLLEEDLYYYTAEAARSYSVEQAAARMAAQHSSELTQEEIHDGLRKEIHRLSLSKPSRRRGGTLVRIPSLPYGRLTQSGEGFREYQIEFRTDPAPIDNIVVFLRRLQQSPQALFVNSLTLERAAQEEYMTPSFVVTRTIIDDAPIEQRASEGETNAAPNEQKPESQSSEAPKNLIRNSSFEEWDSASSSFPEWISEGCIVSRSTGNVSDGTASLNAFGSEERGTVYQRHSLVAGKQYKLDLDATVSGTVSIAVWNEDAKSFIVGSAPLKNDGKTWRQPVPFVVPGPPGEVVTVFAPYIVLEDKSATVYLDNVVLSAVKE